MGKIRVPPKPCVHDSPLLEATGKSDSVTGGSPLDQFPSPKEGPHRRVQVVYLQIYQHLIFFLLFPFFCFCGKRQVSGRRGW